jgi:uncharacterized protein (DUF2252 family)
MSATLPRPRQTKNAARNSNGRAVTPRATASHGKARAKSSPVRGRSLRRHAPRSSHAHWKAPADRRDPVQILIDSGKHRVPHLLPIRYGRMLQSPFAFYRGAAAIMAADLAGTPNTGLHVQICGDCHLMNFGVFATPERHLIFDVNDFDETLPGPWEWDVKRLAASFVIAGRHNGFKSGASRDLSLACVQSYREQMARLATLPVIDVWYERIDVDQLLAHLPEKALRDQARAQIREASHGGPEHDFPKLAKEIRGRSLIRDHVPLIYHPRRAEARELIEDLKQAFRRYRDSLADERRILLDQYELADHAVKVVGVGSVGTRCGVMLLMAGPNDPLFLQVKEATTSVLEPYLAKSKYPNHGERVVQGQRLMQAASDVFLGWTMARGGRQFYIRQLHDVKVKPMVELYDSPTMNVYAQYCGHVLARAHARSGKSKAISEYLGASDRFDQSIGEFAVAYADQNERDFEEFAGAVRKHRLKAVAE